MADNNNGNDPVADDTDHRARILHLVATSPTGAQGMMNVDFPVVIDGTSPQSYQAFIRSGFTREYLNMQMDAALAAAAAARDALAEQARQDAIAQA